MKNLMKTISIVLCLMLALSMSFTALADEVPAATEAPVEDAAEAPAETPAEDAAEDATEAPAEDAAEDATEAPAEDAAENATEAPAEDAAENATEAPAEDSAEAPAETPAEDATEAPVEVAPIEVAPEATPEEVTEVAVPVAPSEITVKVNGTAVVFEDVKPQIIDGRTLVPFRKVGEALNAAVAWRSTDSTVHCFRNGTSIMMTIGQAQFEVRKYEMGEKFVYTSDAEISLIDPEQPGVIARIIDGRTMIPIRAAAEALGATVGWDGATSTVIIDIPAYALTLDDKDAANLVEKWNYKPATELKKGAVDVKVWGNFPGAAAGLGDGVAVEVAGKSATTANGGVCSFADVNAGVYSVKVSNIPAGYMLQNADVLNIEVKAGEKLSLSIALVEGEAEEAPAEVEEAPAEVEEAPAEAPAEEAEEAETETEKEAE